MGVPWGIPGQPSLCLFSFHVICSSAKKWLKPLQKAELEARDCDSLLFYTHTLSCCAAVFDPNPKAWHVLYTYIEVKCPILFFIRARISSNNVQVYFFLFKLILQGDFRSWRKHMPCRGVSALCDITKGGLPDLCVLAVASHKMGPSKALKVVYSHPWGDFIDTQQKLQLQWMWLKALATFNRNADVRYD